MILMLANWLLVASFGSALPTDHASSQDATLREACHNLLNKSTHCEITYAGWQMLSDCMFAHGFRFYFVRLGTIQQELSCPAKLGVCPSAPAVSPPGAESEHSDLPPRQGPPGVPAGPEKPADLGHGRSGEEKTDVTATVDSTTPSLFSSAERMLWRPAGFPDSGWILGIVLSVVGSAALCLVCCLLTGGKKKVNTEDENQASHQTQTGDRAEAPSTE